MNTTQNKTNIDISALPLFLVDGNAISANGLKYELITMHWLSSDNSRFPFTLHHDFYRRQVGGSRADVASVLKDFQVEFGVESYMIELYSHAVLEMMIGDPVHYIEVIRNNSDYYNDRLSKIIRWAVQGVNPDFEQWVKDHLLEKIRFKKTHLELQTTDGVIHNIERGKPVFVSVSGDQSDFSVILIGNDRYEVNNRTAHWWVDEYNKG